MNQIQRTFLLLSLLIAFVWCDCISDCRNATTPSTDCCGCCGEGTCFSSGRYSTCCAPDEDFCGCLDPTRPCRGSFFADWIAMDNEFGSCYPKGVGICTYNPTANVWITCPTILAQQFTGCVGDSSQLGMCCDNATQMCQMPSGICITGDWATESSSDGSTSSNPTSISTPSTSTSSPIETSSSTASNSESSSSSSAASSSSTSQDDCSIQCGDNLLCCPDDFHGDACYSPTQYACTTNDRGLRLLCPADHQSCGDQCFLPDLFTCFTFVDPNLKSGLCPKGLFRCNQACYSSEHFMCIDGKLFGLPPRPPM